MLKLTDKEERNMTRLIKLAQVANRRGQAEKVSEHLDAMIEIIRVARARTDDNQDGGSKTAKRKQ